MKQIICEMCGSHELVKEDGLFVCQYCGCKYTLEEARKMMIEGNVDVSGSTVKVDDSKELENLYQIARRAKDTKDASNAAKYYDMILVKDPNSWEAAFYAAYFKALTCRVGEIRTEAQLLSRTLKSTINLVAESDCAIEEKRKICSEICNAMFTLNGIYLENIARKGPTHTNAMLTEFSCDMVGTISNSMYQLGNAMETKFAEDRVIMNGAVDCWKLGVKTHKIFLDKLPNQSEHLRTINFYKSRIKEYDPTYENNASTNNQKSGGCYVATAVYGSYDCPQVWTLRRFRDYTLAESILGRAFIKVYYAVSPTIVKYFGDTVWFNKAFRKILNNMVTKLNETGVKDTPYEDRVW